MKTDRDDVTSRPMRGCDEDLDGNLHLVEQLAPSLCVACGGYHLSRARKRVGPGAVDMLDRPQIIECVRRYAEERLARRPDTVELLIAGNADTNLLATCAEALSSLDPASTRRLRYLAIDHCQTPLELCKGYALRCGLDLRTALVDVAETHRGFTVDLILLHGLLRFAPAASHVAIMRRLTGWLRPGGVMIFSHRLLPVPSSPGREARPYVAEYQTVRQLHTLFGDAGLRILEMEELNEDDVAPARGRERVLAVLAAGG